MCFLALILKINSISLVAQQLSIRARPEMCAISVSHSVPHANTKRLILMLIVLYFN